MDWCIVHASLRWRKEGEEEMGRGRGNRKGKGRGLEGDWKGSNELWTARVGIR